MNSLIHFLTFPLEYAPFLVSLGILTVLVLSLSTSIKKHAEIYYIVLSIPVALYIIELVLLLTGITSFRLYELPIAGQLMQMNYHMVYFGYPLLVIIMYTGALDNRRTYTKKLLSIRKELSIMAGFPVITHSLIRLFYTFPEALQFFSNHSDYVKQNDWIKSDFGVGISNFGYILGVLMFILFMVLWVTSFTSIRKRMGHLLWKKTQKWAYVLYAMLFIHSITLHIGWMFNWGIAAEDTTYIIKELIAIASTLFIFASYLILRVRKVYRTKQTK